MDTNRLGGFVFINIIGIVVMETDQLMCRYKHGHWLKPCNVDIKCEHDYYINISRVAYEATLICQSGKKTCDNCCSKSVNEINSTILDKAIANCNNRTECSFDSITDHDTWSANVQFGCIAKGKPTDKQLGETVSTNINPNISPTSTTITLDRTSAIPRTQASETILIDSSYTATDLSLVTTNIRTLTPSPTRNLKFESSVALQSTLTSETVLTDSSYTTSSLSHVSTNFQTLVIITSADTASVYSTEHLMPTKTNSGSTMISTSKLIRNDESTREHLLKSPKPDKEEEFPVVVAVAVPLVVIILGIIVFYIIYMWRKRHFGSEKAQEVNNASDTNTGNRKPIIAIPNQSYNECFCDDNIQSTVTTQRRLSNSRDSGYAEIQDVHENQCNDEYNVINFKLTNVPVSDGYDYLPKQENAIDNTYSHIKSTQPGAQNDTTYSHIEDNHKLTRNPENGQAGRSMQTTNENITVADGLKQNEEDDGYNHTNNLRQETKQQNQHDSYGYATPCKTKTITSELPANKDANGREIKK